MDADGSTADFVSVADDVVGVGQHRPRIATDRPANSGLGAVKAWCTAVRAPDPGDVSGGGGIVGGLEQRRIDDQVKAHAFGSIRSRRLAISPRAAPRRARELRAEPAEKNMQSPGLAPTWAASPSRSASDGFLATGPLSVPSSPIST